MKSLQRLEKKVFDTIGKFSLVSAGEKILLAVSGGADSMTLLHLLAAFQESLGLKLFVYSIDHGLRKEAKKEIELVRLQSEKLKIPFCAEAISVPELARGEKISMEEAGHKVRRRLLRAARSRLGAHKIATGHTLDDQAETLLLHIIRGSGIEGLTGIRAFHPEGFIRPLINCRRADILDYCRLKNIPYALDESNLDTGIARNRVRAELLPLLEGFNPRIRESLGRLAEQVQAESDFLKKLAGEEFSRLSELQKDQIVLPHKELGTVPRAVLNRIFRMSIKKLRGDLKDISEVHLDNIHSILKGSSGRFTRIPGGIRVVKDQESLRILPEIEEPPPSPVEISLPGSYQLKDWNLKIEIELLEQEEGRPGEKNYFSLDPWQAFLDAGKVGDKIMIRGRVPGDRYQPPGELPSRRLKKLLQEKRIPAEERDKIGLLEVLQGKLAGKIAWIIGIDRDRSFIPGSECKKVYYLKAEKIN